MLHRGLLPTRHRGDTFFQYTVLISLKFWHFGILSFVVAYLAHLVLWNRIQLKRDVLALFAVFFLGVPPLLLVLFYYTQDGVGLIAPLCTHFILAVNYIAIYPAFQASSPTIHILNFLWKKPEGTTEKELLDNFALPKLVEDRMADLHSAKLIEYQGGAPTLTRKGLLLASFFATYRAWLGLSKGKG